MEDLANVYIEVIDYLENNESDIFMRYRLGYSVNQIVNTMKTVTRNDIKIETIKRREGDLTFLVEDNTKVLTKMQGKP